jgi:Protein of unknown function (DUF2628)
MRLYTVYLPENRSGTPAQPAAEGAIFVRDGFHFWAFLLGPLWCLWRGLWLPALAVIALGAVLLGIGRAFQFSTDTQILAGFVLALFIGLEAPNLRRLGLRQRRYVERGSVAARNLADAEAIFFANAPQTEPQPPSSASAADQVFAGRGPAGEEIVGLFPEYRGR